jgi:acyl dehydratase
MAFEAMNAFLADCEIELSRIVHGEQRFAYERSVRVGDELTATLSVASLRQIGGNDIIGTRSEIRDASGDLVCTTTATLVHRGGQEESQ